MNILAIDPGPVQSALVLLGPDRKILEASIESNKHVASILRAGRLAPSLVAPGWPHVAIEMIASYGMPVGAEVFETCTWIGRFEEAYVHTDLMARYFRKDIKLHLCGSNRARDSNVRQALIDLLGPAGVKKNPGPTYGIKKDMWAAPLSPDAQDIVEAFDDLMGPLDRDWQEQCLAAALQGPEYCDCGEIKPEPPAAQPTPPVAPVGGLVERVGEAMERHHFIGDIEGSWDAQARAAIREVAAWMRENETGFNAARWLELEANG